MSLPIAVNIDGGEGGRIAQSAEQKELDFGERGRYLIDALSKRRNGISSSYPDLLDPSFGSCLRGESPKEGKKNGGRTQNRTGDTGIFSPHLLSARNDHWLHFGYKFR